MKAPSALRARCSVPHTKVCRPPVISSLGRVERRIQIAPCSSPFLFLGSAPNRWILGFTSRFLKALGASLSVLENGTLAPVQLRRPSPCSELAECEYHPEMLAPNQKIILKESPFRMPGSAPSICPRRSVSSDFISETWARPEAIGAKLLMQMVGGAGKCKFTIRRVAV